MSTFPNIYTNLSNRVKLTLILIFLTSFNYSIRFYSFDRSVMDWDESTYILAGQALHENNYKLYTDIIDVKPVGIFLIYYLNSYLFDDLILGSRVLGWLFVSFTSFIIGLVAAKIYNLKIFYSMIPGIIFSSLMAFCFPGSFNENFYGLDINSEHYFMLFSTLSIFIILKSQNKTGLFLSGSCLGFAFIIKYVVIAQLFILFIIIFYNSKGSDIKALNKIGRDFLKLFVSFCLPVVIVIIYFSINHRLEELIHSTFTIPSNYRSDISIEKYYDYFRRYLIRIWPLVILSLASFIYIIRSNKYKTGYLLSFIWLFASILGILLPGRTFFHYTYQLAPAVTLLSFPIIERAEKLSSNFKYLFIILFILGTWKISNNKYLKIFKPEDEVRVVATELSDIMMEQDILFIDNTYHIIYMLTEKIPPTPYFHPSNIYVNFEKYFIDRDEEYYKIFEVKKPNYVLILGEPSSSIIKKYLQKYSLIKTVNEKYNIYQLH